MRMRNKPWAEGFLRESRAVLRVGGGGRMPPGFENDNPTHVEIGCGKGGFTVNMALLNPDINFIGLEMDKNALASAVKGFADVCREREGEPQNIKFALGRAENITDYFEPRSIERIYINFCDPWRNRAGWRKRRLTHSGFLGKYRAVLAEGGGVWFKTDNRNLFEFSVSEFTKQGWVIKNATEDLAGNDSVMTEYEVKFREMGLPIFRTEAYVS